MAELLLQLGQLVCVLRQLLLSGFVESLCFSNVGRESSLLSTQLLACCLGGHELLVGGDQVKSKMLKSSARAFCCTQLHLQLCQLSSYSSADSFSALR
eukprot:2482674-Pleurochrysis_carterae.AAC.2